MLNRVMSRRADDRLHRGVRALGSNRAAGHGADGLDSRGATGAG